MGKYNPSHLELKIEVLSDVGINDKAKVKAYLENAIKGLQTEEQKQRRLDLVARRMISAYFEGDRKFVAPIVPTVKPKKLH